jgi:hypothetical protein
MGLIVGYFSELNIFDKESANGELRHFLFST